MKKKEVMKKKEEMISIPQKKAAIIGLGLSLIFAIFCGYASAAMILDLEILEGKNLDIFDIGNILFPPLFVVFGVFILIFIVICSIQKKKK